MTKKVLAILASSVVMMFIIGYGISFFSAGPSNDKIDSAQAEIEDIFLGKKSLGHSVYSEELFITMTKDKLLSEELIQETIHWMSHQKVVANQKWGHDILITQERVGILIDVVGKNDFPHSNILDILNCWYIGDFSQADKDHNAIWKIQNGNIGKARGLLNAVEQLNYLEKNSVR